MTLSLLWGKTEGQEEEEVEDGRKEEEEEEKERAIWFPLSSNLICVTVTDSLS